MKNKKPQNKFDNLVERLIAEFVKIPNFDLMSTDAAGNKVFNIVTYRLAEINSYRQLVCQQFIPATNKAIFESKQDFSKSRYKALLNTKHIDFNETLDDTIRLAYVGLFHKFENYRNDVLKIPDLIFGGMFQSDKTVETWAKEKFDFDLKDSRRFHLIHKINWICNCVKHKDGFPVKTPKPSGFQFLDESKRIVLTPEDFKKDSELLVQFYNKYLQLVLIFAQHKLCTEIIPSDRDFLSPERHQELLAKLSQLEENVKKFISDEDLREKVDTLELDIKSLTAHMLDKIKEKRALS